MPKITEDSCTSAPPYVIPGMAVNQAQNIIILYSDQYEQNIWRKQENLNFHTN
jgi:hypothetical protein